MSKTQSKGVIALKSDHIHQTITYKGKVLVAPPLLRYLDFHMNWDQVKKYLLEIMKDYSTLALLAKELPVYQTEELEGDGVLTPVGVHMQHIEFLTEFISNT